MDRWEFLRWRRMIGYTQEKAAEKLGVVRSTIVNWESETGRVPLSIDLACCELTRRWKQRPEFGPVHLVYTDSRETSPTSKLHCETHTNNDAAIRRALTLSHDLINPLILDGNSVVWSVTDLLYQCELRRERTTSGASETAELSTQAHGKPRTVR